MVCCSWHTTYCCYFNQGKALYCGTVRNTRPVVCGGFGLPHAPNKPDEQDKQLAECATIEQLLHPPSRWWPTNV